MSPYGKIDLKSIPICGNIKSCKQEIFGFPAEHHPGGQHRTVDAYFAWLHTLAANVDRSSRIGEAILYTLNQKKYLRRYLEDGHLSIDNNDCERNIKNFAVGRRNWLFAKSIKGADASAIVYSITETAILHGLRPYNYLSYVMEKISQAPEFGDNSYLDDLLPWSPALPDNLKSNIVRK